MDEDKLHSAVRNYGLHDLDEVRLVLWEADGTINIVPKKQEG